MTTTRRLAAILAADVAGYSRLMAVDEVGTLEALKTCRREVVDPNIAEHNGRIVKTTGDGMLVEFASAVDAVTCAMVVQEKMAARGGDIAFRIGINVGDIIIDGDDIFGDGVNVAARVENECQPGGVCMSANAVEQVRNKTSFAFDDLGERSLKNIDRPIRLFAARLGAGAPTAMTMLEPDKPLPLPDKPSIAVLPFQNMSGDPDQEYFADRIVEDIITALSRFKSLFVIARNSSFTYKGKPVDIKQVGRELGVRYVLEGSVRKAGGKVRITGQLIEAETNKHLWADKYDGDSADIFALQDSVTIAVVAAVAPSIERSELNRASLTTTSNPGAYDYLLRGRRDMLAATVEMNQTALQHFAKAIDLDAGYARAYASAAMCYFLQLVYGWSEDRADTAAKATAFANKAAELGPDDAGVLSLAANVIAFYGHQHELGEDMVNRANLLNPNLADAWRVRGWISVWLGKPEDAIEPLQTALRLSPIDTALFDLYTSMGAAQLYSGHPEQALIWLAKALARRPNWVAALNHSIVANVELGRLDEARRLREVMQRVVPRYSISVLKTLAFRRRSDLERIINANRLAGLPE